MLELLFAVASLLFALALVWLALTMLIQMILYVPFVPTPQKVVDAMIALADLRDGDRVIDIGAGDGRLMMAAATHVPAERIAGYEIARPVWLLGRFRLWLAGVDADLHCHDFRSADLSSASVIFCYLSPRMMKHFASHIMPTLRPGTRVVSHGFPLPGHEPREQRVVMIGRRRARVFLYVV